MQGKNNPSSQPNDPLSEQRGANSTIDIPELMARVGGDTGLLRELCEVFNNELPGMVLALERAIQAGGAEAISRTAHGLKGAISVFEKGPSFKSALAVEMAGKSNRIDAARTEFEALLSNLEALKSEIADLARTAS